MCSALKLQVSQSLGKKKQNRQSSGKLATSLLVLNSSHWEGLSQQYARGGICSNLQVLLVGPFLDILKKLDFHPFFALVKSTNQKWLVRSQ